MKRAVAYVRVSNGKKGIHSFEAQESHWRDKITPPDYEFVGIFKDKVSGQHLKNRHGFQAMLKLAGERGFDTIFVKSVSRFARNTEELIDVVHQLREFNINVIFENEGIDTVTTNSELFLQIAAAVAQDQIRTYSLYQKWSVSKRMADGKNVYVKRPYGYDIKDGQLVVNEDEFRNVKLIFELYLQGMSVRGIVKELNERKIPNWRGEAQWSRSTIYGMFSNEKYAGNSLLRKYIQTMGVTKKNTGEEDMFFIENSHMPALSAEEYEKFLQERKNRRVESKMPITPYPFTKKIQCACCGGTFLHKINNAATPYAKGMWRCSTFLSKGKISCPSYAIFDEVINPLFIEAYNEFAKQKNAIHYDSRYVQKKSELLRYESNLRKLKVKKLISEDDYKKETAQLLSEISELDNEIKRQAMGEKNLQGVKELQDFDESAVEYLNKAIIENQTITFIFCNGFTVTKKFDNGKGGNKKGWMAKRKQGSG